MRCANCGKTWQQMPIEEAKARASQPAMEEAIPGPDDNFLQGESGNDVYEFGDEELEKKSAANENPVAIPMIITTLLHTPVNILKVYWSV